MGPVSPTGEICWPKQTTGKANNAARNRKRRNAVMLFRLLFSVKCKEVRRELLVNIILGHLKTPNTFIHRSITVGQKIYFIRVWKRETVDRLEIRKVFSQNQG